MKLKTSDHYSWVVRKSDEIVPGILASRQLSPDMPDYGGFIIDSKGFNEPGSTAGRMSLLINLYCNRDSLYWKDQEILDCSFLFSESLLRHVHEDGTIDLRETNFHCASTMAFTFLHGLTNSYRILSSFEESNGLNSKEKQLKKNLYDYFIKGGEGMLNGGFHTPNHRWVNASALTLLFELTQDKRYADHARLYLNEGIDCNEEGEYTEKSIAIYNKPVNEALIIMSRGLKRSDLLEYVKRNLASVPFYMEPDETLFTLSSRRQDNGRESFPFLYYNSFLLMFQLTDNKQYAWWAEKLYRLARNMCISIDDFSPEILGLFMTNPEMTALESETEPVSFDIQKFNRLSGLVRMRQGCRSLGLLTKNSSFLKFQKGSNSLILRMTSSFFGDKGRFIPDKIEELSQGEYKLSFSSRWGYIRPFQNYTGTSDWDKMDNASRDKVHLQDFKAEAIVKFDGEKVRIQLNTEGVKDVPLRIELIAKEGGRFTTGDVSLKGQSDSSLIFRGTEAYYKKGNDTIKITGGMGEHHYTENLRGAEPSLSGHFTIYLAGFTPLNHVIELE